MANTLTGLIPTIYSALDVVSRELTGFIPSVYIDPDSAEKAAVNETISVPVPAAETAGNVTAGSVPPDDGDTTVASVEMSISKSRYVPVRFTGEEQKGLNNGGKYEEIVKGRFAQAFRTLANEIETDLAALYVGASRAWGTAGTTPFASSLADVAQIKKILDDNGCPDDGNRSLVINTTAGVNLRTLANLTQASANGSDQTLRSGILLPLMGLSVRESAQVKSHTKGTATGFDQNKAAGASYAIGDTAITVDGSDSGTILAGDVITWAGDLNKYIVASTTASGAASGIITFNANGLRQTLAAGVEGTIGGNYTANMAFHRSALVLAARVPAAPAEGDMADDAMLVTDPATGLTFEIRLYKQYRRIKYEVSIAWGVKCIKPEHFVILLG
jgi:hypothetical protein